MCRERKKRWERREKGGREGKKVGEKGKRMLVMEDQGEGQDGVRRGETKGERIWSKSDGTMVLRRGTRMQEEGGVRWRVRRKGYHHLHGHA